MEVSEMSEVEWMVDRMKLYELRRSQPKLSVKDLVKELGRSESWVRKWRQRQQEAEAEGPSIFQSRSRARHSSNVRVGEEVERAIVEIRDEPPENLGRRPGPLAIVYYLGRREDLQAEGHYLPRSTSTIWKILDRHQRIWREGKGERQPELREAPMTHWQIDYKSISSVPPEEDGKQQHVVETLNCVDKGTSILVAAVPRADYNAETTVASLMDLFGQHGLPQKMSLDRDPRLVGSWTAQEFPSPLMRLLHVLGIGLVVCPPQRPEKNAFVERYHLNYERECLQRYKPDSLAKVIEVTQAYQQHYNYERPNQALTCHNQPPRAAFPTARTSAILPTIVDPDAWLLPASKQLYRRRVDRNGTIMIGNQRYYIRRALAKQQVAIRVVPHSQELHIYLDNKVVKKVAIKGLYHGQMLLEDYVTLICREAVSDARRLKTRRRYQQRRLAQHP
jgi:hypothetical protein